MISFGCVVRLAVAMAFVGAATAAESQSADPAGGNQPAKTAAEIAKAIAATVNANASKTAGAPIAQEK